MSNATDTLVIRVDASQLDTVHEKLKAVAQTLRTINGSLGTATVSSGTGGGGGGYGGGGGTAGGAGGGGVGGGTGNSGRRGGKKTDAQAAADEAQRDADRAKKDAERARKSAEKAGETTWKEFERLNRVKFDEARKDAERTRKEGELAKAHAEAQRRQRNSAAIRGMAVGAGIIIGSAAGGAVAANAGSVGGLGAALGGAIGGVGQGVRAFGNFFESERLRNVFSGVGAAFPVVGGLATAAGALLAQRHGLALEYADYERANMFGSAYGRGVPTGINTKTTPNKGLYDRYVPEPLKPYLPFGKMSHISRTSPESWIRLGMGPQEAAQASSQFALASGYKYGAVGTTNLTGLMSHGVSAGGAGSALRGMEMYGRGGAGSLETIANAFTSRGYGGANLEGALGQAAATMQQMGAAGIRVFSQMYAGTLQGMANASNNPVEAQNFLGGMMGTGLRAKQSLVGQFQGFADAVVLSQAAQGAGGLGDIISNIEGLTANPDKMKDLFASFGLPAQLALSGSSSFENVAKYLGSSASFDTGLGGGASAGGAAQAKARQAFKYLDTMDSKSATELINAVGDLRIAMNEMTKLLKIEEGGKGFLKLAEKVLRRAMDWMD